jgi:hypothetical protein
MVRHAHHDKQQSLPLFAAEKKIQDEAEDDADEDACREGEIEGEMLALDQEVSGQPADPRNLSAQHEKKTHSSQDQADDDQNFPEMKNLVHPVSTFQSRLKSTEKAAPD